MYQVQERQYEGLLRPCQEIHGETGKGASGKLDYELGSIYHLLGAGYRSFSASRNL